jgi:hypothetical protein
VIKRKGIQGEEMIDGRPAGMGRVLKGRSSGSQIKVERLRKK